jgi:hypothetical protein
MCLGSLLFLIGQQNASMLDPDVALRPGLIVFLFSFCAEYSPRTVDCSHQVVAKAVTTSLGSHDIDGCCNGSSRYFCSVESEVSVGVPSQKKRVKNGMNIQ